MQVASADRTSLYSIDFPNGKRYIGISKNPEARFRNHISVAKSGEKFKVSNALRKFNYQAELRVLAIGSREYIADLEIKAIVAYKTRDDDCGYNISIGGDVGAMCGRNHSEETKKLLSAKKTGVPNPSAIGNKYGVGNLGNVGRKASPETKAKMSAIRKGRPSDKKGITLTAEHRAKCSAALKGRSSGMAGKKHSNETRAKLSASRMGNKNNLGNKASGETREKLRIAIKARERDALGRIMKVGKL